MHIMRMDREVEQQLAPKTRILSKDEKEEVIRNLLINKEEMANILGHLPISMKTMAIRDKKNKFEKQLAEIEQALETFSQEIVYINKDS